MKRHVLRAGAIEAVLDGADLRDIRVGDVMLAQRVYVAVRDAPWNTIPGEVSDVEIRHRNEDFTVTFTSRHRYEDIDYEWRGVIEGSADGVLTYTMDGEAKRAFTHSKIGLNLHHPLPEYVGSRYRASTENGEIEGTFPRRIDPQLVRDGTPTAMFDHFDALTVDLPGGLVARFTFEGDYFETQDHRNWSDANYKTYGTPLSFGFPMDVEAGERFHQRLTVSFEGDAAPRTERSAVDVTLGEGSGGGLPALGLGMASHGGDLSEGEAALLSAVRPDHLRVDLQVDEAGHEAELDRAVCACQALGAGLELAVFVTEASEQALAALSARVAGAGVPLRRVLAYEAASGFSITRLTTPPALVELVRAAFPPGQTVAGGTDQFFNELNRARPAVDAFDGVAFSLNPQVHACDDRSVMQNLTAISHIAESTRAISGQLPIFVSPVTFVGRLGPFPAGPPDADGLPGQVDVRQAEMFGAAWTAGSLREFAAAGIAAVTYFETTGWRGVVETDEGPPRPDLFPSRPGSALPLYHVLADAAEWKEGELVATESSDPFAVSALAVRDAAGTHLLVANLTDDVQTASLGPLSAGQAHVRLLDDTTCEQATSAPRAYREAPFHLLHARGGRLHLTLAPYAVARVDVPS